MSCGQAAALDILCGLGAHYWYNKHEPLVSWTLLIQISIIPLPSALLLANHVSVITAVVAAYSLFLITLFASIVAYRVSPYHPLAKYPGPLLCKVSQLWSISIATRGKLHHYRKQLHEQYGSIVRIGPNELSIADKDLLPLIIGTHGMPKGPLFEGRRMTPISDKEAQDLTLISSRNPQRHAVLRKAWNKAFANSPLKDYEELLLLRAHQLIESLERICKEQGGVGRGIDIATWIGYFSFDFMGDMAFGGGFELMRDGDKEKFLHNMTKTLYYPAMCQFVPWFSCVLRNLPYIGAPMRAFGLFGFQRAKTRYNQELKRKDLFYHLIEAYHTDSQESPFPLIVANSLLAIIAGSDTTASVLSNVIYYLLMNPTFYAQLREELDTAFPPTEMSLLNTDVLPSLPMLNAVINEVLRLQPPVPTSLQRAPTRGTGGKMIGNHYIREGTAIQVSPYVLHRDPRYFYPKPDDFWPTRWLPQSSDAPGFILERSVFIPFSAGPANCAGKPLAMLELRAIVALLFMHFEMEFDDGFDPKTWMDSLKDYFVLEKGKLMVKMRVRERQSLAH
ncbi:hypothetical protein HYDPIDRAFT_24675 [Hydnomerulius pinastri MD-312]|nr:hypothetical protein HYDPIDRAFT_24675 [Hydnomerulius pinastri MD-312]